MDRIAVRGGSQLRGEVAASGSKNSTLALMAGALLARGETRLANVPRLRDVAAMLEILRALGARADSGLVRGGATQAVVTATFELAADHPAHALLAENGLETEPGEPLIVRRIVLRVRLHRWRVREGS